MKDPGLYTLVSRLGEGGMAEVFKAIKQGPDGFEKPIALKRILPHLADNPSFIKMLSVEARIMAMLDHPNLVHVSDFFIHGGTFFLAMEYVVGHNLRTVMHEASQARTPIPWQVSVHIIAETLKGLDYAHKRRGPDGPLKIVHRDVSPQNILLSDDGWVKLSDFGIARANVARDETQSGVLKGKSGYLSPEQLQSWPVDARSDLFSTAVVLYELLAGLHPFKMENEFDTMKKIVEGNFTPLSEVRPELPQAVLSAVTRTLTTDPTKRPVDAAEFRSLLLSGQDTRWLASGQEELCLWLKNLYPEGSASAEQAIEKTPFLSMGGTPIPHQIAGGQSMISEAGKSAAFAAFLNRGKWRRGILWVSVGVLAAVTGSLLLKRENTNLVTITSPPLVAEPALLATPAPKSPRTAGHPIGPPGRLGLTGPAGAIVYINGKPVGKMPLPPMSLPPGEHSVLMAVPGQPSTMARVAIRSGKTSKFEWKGKP